MNDIFKKSPRRLRKEKKQRQQEREQQKKQLENLTKLYSDKKSKLYNMKRMEKTRSFQQDFNKMKSLLVNPKPIEPVKKRPMKEFIKDYNIFSKNNIFPRTKVRGF